MSSEPAAVAHHAPLEEVERLDEDKPVFFLTYTEVKLLGIAGVSLFYSIQELNVVTCDYLGWILP
jgi:PHS family inorganic phosphate transporter-like MFS transporter